MADSYIKVCRDYLDYSIVSSDSNDAAWPWMDMKKYAEQFKGGKAANSAKTLIVLDLGAAKQVNLVALYNVNFDTYKIKGNSTSDFTTPAYATGNITVSKDIVTERYKSIVNPQDYAAFNYRYIGIEIQAGTPLDGDTEWFIGTLALSASAELFAGNTSPGLLQSPVRSQQSVTMLSGAPKSVSRGPRRMQIAFNRTISRTLTNFQMVAKYLLTLDTDNVLIFAFNGLLLESGDSNEQYFYMMTAQGGMGYSLTNVGQADLNSGSSGSTITLVEVG